MVLILVIDTLYHDIDLLKPFQAVIEWIAFNQSWSFLIIINLWCFLIDQACISFLFEEINSGFCVSILL